MLSRSWPYGPAIAATAADILDKAIVMPSLPFFLSNSSSEGIGVPEAADGSDDEDDRLLGLNKLSLSEDDRSDDEDSGSDEEEEGRTSARVLQARKRHLQAETRVDVRSYHAKHRALTVPYDPNAVDVQTVCSHEPLARARGLQEGDALRKAQKEREEASAAQFAERGIRGSRRTGENWGPGRLASARGRRP